MRNYILLFSLVVIATACKQKKEEMPGSNFISILSLVKKQVAHIDTSLYPIIKIVYTDSNHKDTTHISREQFADAARDFLEIPDLSDQKVAKRYKEEPGIYDQTMKRAIFTYLPLDPDNEEVKKQEILVTPVLGGDAKVNNIIIVREIRNRDSFLQKKMLWQMDRSFQVVTTSQKPGKPEVTTVTKVAWNEDPLQ